VVRGANTAVSRAAAPSTHSSCAAVAAPAISPRSAVARWLIGLTSATAQPAGHSVGVDEDVAHEGDWEEDHEADAHHPRSGCAGSGRGWSTPRRGEGEDEHQATAATIANTPPRGSKPMINPSPITRLEASR